MAAPTTTDAWDEYVTAITNGDVSFVDSWNIGLYLDSTDNIQPTDTGSPGTEITTEPSGGGYATEVVTPTTDVETVANAGDFQHDVDDITWSSLTFSSGTNVDAWYMSLSTNLPSDGGTTEHLMAVGLLTGGPYDLQNYTDFTVQNIGIRQTQG